jgi:putative PIN family toxin of toxin-antitoxin system
VLKVVIDTNLLIDGAADFYSYCSRILDAVIAGQITAYANRATLRENRFITPKKITDSNYLNKLEFYFDSVRLVENSEKAFASEDEQDNKLLESAAASKADYLITSDHHLLKLENYHGSRIVRPEEFWNIYQDKTSDGWKEWLRKFIS